MRVAFAAPSLVCSHATRISISLLCDELSFLEDKEKSITLGARSIRVSLECAMLSSTKKKPPTARLPTPVCTKCWIPRDWSSTRVCESRTWFFGRHKQERSRSQQKSTPRKLYEIADRLMRYRCKPRALILDVGGVYSSTRHTPPCRLRNNVVRCDGPSRRHIFHDRMDLLLKLTADFAVMVNCRWDFL